MLLKFFLLPINLIRTIPNNAGLKYIFAIFSGGGYDPREMLSDAVATLVFMPTKFERTTFTLAEKFNFSVHDVNTLTVKTLYHLWPIHEKAV